MSLVRKLIAVSLLFSTLSNVCTASRAEQEYPLRGDHLRGAGDQGSRYKALQRSLQVLAKQQQAVIDANVEYAVDYAEENDPPFYSDEGGVQQVMTYSTYYPQQGSKPCHHNKQHQPQRWQGTISAAPDAADAADADVLVAAASHAWKKAQQLAARLAAADAAETAELVAELEASLQGISGADAAGQDIIDHRWEEFDGAAADTEGSFMSEALADYINPAGAGPDEDDAHITQDDMQDGTIDQSVYDTAEDMVAVLLLEQPAPLPADDPSTATAAAGKGAMQEVVQDMGLFIIPDDNAANNLALFGVRTPAEVAAAAAAAAPGAQYDRQYRSSAGSSWLERISGAAYEPVDAQKAATVLIVGCTLMVAVAFLFNVIELRATLQAAAASATSSNDISVSGRYASVPAGAMALRTCKSGYGGCSAVAAAAAAAAAAAMAMGGGCEVVVGAQQGCDAGGDDLSRPLLLDVEGEDVEAALVLQAAPAAVLPPPLQKFYNPMHYQQLPSGSE